MALMQETICLFFLSHACLINECPSNTLICTHHSSRDQLFSDVCSWFLHFYVYPVSVAFFSVYSDQAAACCCGLCWAAGGGV
jgi:hypothetical protein